MEVLDRRPLRNRHTQHRRGEPSKKSLICNVSRYDDTTPNSRISAHAKRAGNSLYRPRLLSSLTNSVPTESFPEPYAHVGPLTAPSACPCRLGKTICMSLSSVNADLSPRKAC